jgi:hypothetical protein
MNLKALSVQENPLSNRRGGGEVIPKPLTLGGCLKTSVKLCVYSVELSVTFCITEYTQRTTEQNQINLIVMRQR